MAKSVEKYGAPAFIMVTGFIFAMTAWLDLPAIARAQDGSPAPAASAPGPSSSIPGTITGRVHGPGDSAIPGATVLLINQKTGERKETWTDEAGIYRLEADPGTYR